MMSSTTRLLLSTALTATGLVALASSPAMANNWTNLQGDGFSTDITVPDTTNITQHLDVVKARGDLDITENHTVNILQPGSTSLFAAYDIEGDPTYILGRLNANGQVLVIDQNGVFFGRNSVVNVGSIIATTGQIAEDDLGDKKFTIKSKDTDGSIELNGSITVAEGGLAAFVAPSVINNGIIDAKLGRVEFAAGEKVTVDLYGDDLVNLVVEDKLGNAILDNSGIIKAEGGTVQMTANAAKDAVDNIINMDGVIDVSSVTVKGGKIILGGDSKGAVKVSGKMKADGTEGGSIRITGGSVTLTPDSILSADATDNGNGGDIGIWGHSYAIMGGSASARGGRFGGNGGFIEVSAKDAVGFSGLVDTSAENGQTGTFLIDPQNINLGNFAFWDIGSLITTLKVDAQSLANTLRFTNVHLWATNKIYTSAAFDISTWKGLIPSNKGLTSNDLTLSAKTIDINHNITLGLGDLILRDALTTDSVFGFGLVTPPSDINLETVNLDAKIRARDTVGGAASTANLSVGQISGQAETVNVLSNDALINQGIAFVQTGGTVNISADTYQEQIIIDRDMSLIGEDRDTTIIQSPAQLAQTNTSPHGARNYGVIWAHDANVNISNLTIDGSTNAQAGGYNNNNRFIGVIYQNAGGTFENNRITNIITAGNNTRSGFGLLATDDEGATSVLNILNNVIDGFQSFGIALANFRLDATLKGNEITGDKDNVGVNQTGLYVIAGAKVTAGGANPGESNTIADTDNGIEITGSKNGVYENNVIDGVHNGIIVKNSGNTQLLGNTIAGNSTVGITVDGSNGTVVSGGSVSNFDTGILVNNSDNVTVQGVIINDILDGNAIHVNDSDLIQILSNYIGFTDAGVTEGAAGNINGDGVYLFQSNDAAIKGNKITQTASTGTNIGSGVHLKTSHNAVIGGAGADENIITNAQWDGIRLSASNNVQLRNNDIDNVTRTGIYAESADGFLANNNDIDNAGRDGIFIYGMSDARITNNRIGTNGGAGNIGQWGVHVTNGKDVRVLGNIIHDTVFDGILASGVRTAIGDTYAIRIVDNTIRRSGDNGIRIINLKDSAGVAGEGRALVRENFVRNTGLNGVLVVNSEVDALSNIINNTGNSKGGGDGIRLQESDNSVVRLNEIGLLGNADNINGDGIYGEFSNNLIISRNEIANTDSPFNDIGSGIQLYRVNGATIARNFIHDTDWDGIRLENVSNITVRRNDIENIVRTGSYAEYSNNVVYDRNEIDNVGRDGIFVYGTTNSSILSNRIGTNGGAGNIGQWGVHVTNGSNIEIDNNRIFDANDGIIISGTAVGAGPYAVMITDNVIRRSAQHGIEMRNAGDSLITGNRIINSGAVGILASRGANGQFTIADNTIRLFDIGMKFESGTIDLTGAANTIEDGNTGMLFSRYDLGGGSYAPLSLVENDAIGTSTPFVPGVEPTDYAGTLGDTIFNNITGQYVELDNFAFWDSVNGVPFWIDARSATYDGIRPIDFPGAILDPVTYALLEDKLLHFPDGRDVGIFFFGSLPGSPDIDESQFFRTFDAFNGDVTGLNIRILGLPSTGFGGPAPGGLAGALNNIVPFAGGTSPEDLNRIETAAGEQGQQGQQGTDPADIEPAAGGDTNAPCWGDALNVAQTGQAVNVVYGGSLDDALASAASCNNGTL